MANVTGEELQRLWLDYFVFSVVRNPLSRAISSYKFVVSATLAKPECSNLVSRCQRQQRGGHLLAL